MRKEVSLKYKLMYGERSNLGNHHRKPFGPGKEQMKIRIVFVDDDPKMLAGLQKRFRGMRNEWEMTFAGSGQEALEILQREAFHILVTDMRMPGMDGAELLRRVEKLYPHIVRIILSENSDAEMILKSAGPAHQCLSKPCDAGKLKMAVARAGTMRSLLKNEALINLISGIETLPSLPSLYTEVVNEANSPNGSLNKVGEIISKDVGMSAKILQLVNSSFFGLPSHVNSPIRAVCLLGLETIKSLIISVKIFSQFNRSGLSGFPISRLWNHSIATGIIARGMATQKDAGQNRIDEAFMAGLLHDVGKLILLDRLPQQYLEITAMEKSLRCPLWEAEQKVLGTTHAQVGAYLMGIWGLSESIVEALAYHHCPSKCPNESFSTLTAVHLANSVEHESSTGSSLNRLDFQYLEKLGIDDQGRDMAGTA